MTTADILPNTTHHAPFHGTNPGEAAARADTPVGHQPIVPRALIALVHQLARQAASNTFKTVPDSSRQPDPQSECT